MKENLLPQKTLLLWQIRFAIIGILLSCMSAFLWFLSSWFLLLVLLIVVVFLVIMYWYLPHYFNSYEITFPKGAIIIHRGVFIKTSHIMPYSKLIYAQSISTPLAKRMGLSAMSLKAARSSLLIPEVSESDVNDFITSLTKEDSD